jgi:hypothetical protein
MAPPKLNEQMRDAIRQAWREGADPIDLQVDYDIANSTLYRVVQGIPNGRGVKSGRPRALDYTKAAQLRAQGVKVAVIASRLGVTENTVFVALRRMRVAA